MPLDQTSERLGVTPLEGLVVEAEVQGGPVAQAGMGGLVGGAAGPLSKRVSDGRSRISITRLV